MKRKTWKERYKESANLQLFVVICGAILFYILLSHFGVVRNAIGYVLEVLSPIILAVVIAFLLSPVIVFMEKKVFGRIRRRKALHAICVILTVLILCVLLLVMLYLLLSQLAASVSHLVANFDNYMKTLSRMLGDTFSDIAKEMTVFGLNVGDLLNFETSSLEELGSAVITWCSEHAEGILGGAMSVGSNIFNTLITVMLVIYMLLDIDHMQKSISRYFRSILEPDRYVRYAELASKCSHVFLRYFGSNLLDALIIGVACYLFMWIMGLPYGLLIAVFVGVCNLIPTFGPIVGAVVGAFLILLLDPLGALWFLIYSVVSQFIDANVLKPKLFGDTTGLRPMWILAAIIVGGGLFGVGGMLLGVPLFAIIAIIVNERIEKRLQRWDYAKEDLEAEE